MDSSRRQFLKSSAFASVAPLLADAALASRSATLEPRAFVVEASSPEAKLFGARLASHRQTVHEIRADITAVWFEHFDRQWRDRPMLIAGITLRPALFCLEQLALVHGMRVVHHGVHTRLGPARTSHVINRSFAGYGTTELAFAGSMWPDAIADDFMSLRSDRTVSGGGLVGGPLDCQSADSALHSWVIVPVARPA